MPNDLKSIKAYLRAQPALKLGGGFILKDKNPKDFIKNFFLNYNKHYPTVHVVSGIVHTSANRMRSASDAFMITYHYFPRVKMITVYRVLFQLLKENLISSCICSTIHKRIFYTVSKGYTSKVDQKPTDETGFDYTEMPEFAGIQVTRADNVDYIYFFDIPKVD